VARFTGTSLYYWKLHASIFLEKQKYIQFVVQNSINSKKEEVKRFGKLRNAP